MRCIVISGFLGSGKTTLVNNIIKDTGDSERVALLINEFGDIPVDTAIIDRRNFTMREITGGCICCSLKGKLKDAVEEIHHNPSPDSLIIEATGLAVAEEIIQEIIPLEGISTAGILCIDPEQYRIFAGKLAIYKRQLQGARLILLTKTDIRPPELILETENQCMKEQPETLLLTDFRQAYNSLAFQTEPSPSRFTGMNRTTPLFYPPVSPGATEPVSGIDQITVLLVSPVDPAELEKRCRSLSELYGNKLYRLKGIIKTEKGSAVFHFIDNEFVLQTLDGYETDNDFAVVIAGSEYLEKYHPKNYLS